MYFGEDVFDRTRRNSRDLVRKRQSVMYVAHYVFRHSQTKVGMAFGNFDHVTVLNAKDVIAYEMNVYPYILKYVTDLQRKCAVVPKPKTSVDLMRQLLASRTLGVNVKIELKVIIKMLQHENNKK